MAVSREGNRGRARGQPQNGHSRYGGRGERGARRVEEPSPDRDRWRGEWRRARGREDE